MTDLQNLSSEQAVKQATTCLVVCGGRLCGRRLVQCWCSCLLRWSAHSQLLGVIVSLSPPHSDHQLSRRVLLLLPPPQAREDQEEARLLQGRCHRSPGDIQLQV